MLAPSILVPEVAAVIQGQRAGRVTDADAATV
jgi:hypothetical protein